VKDLSRIENLLHGFQKKPLPSGMRKKILRFAHQEAVQMQPLVNAFWRIAAVCSALIVVVILLDTQISENQSQRISALQKTSFGSKSAEVDDDITIILNALDGTHDSPHISWIKSRYFREKKSVGTHQENREFQIFPEDFNGS